MFYGVSNKSDKAPTMFDAYLNQSVHAFHKHVILTQNTEDLTSTTSLKCTISITTSNYPNVC